MTDRALELKLERPLERRGPAKTTIAQTLACAELRRARTAARWSGDVAAYTAACTRLLEDPSSEHTVGHGWLQHNHVERTDPGDDARQGVHEGAGRPAQCFEAAHQFVLQHPWLRDLKLTHGYISEHNMPWRHAWAEFRGDAGDVVYDTTVSRFFKLPSYYQVMGALPVVVYTPEEALASLRRTGSWGPWEPFAEASKRLRDQWIDELRTRRPELVTWVEQMCERDQDFAACWRQLPQLEPYGLAVVQLLFYLEGNPAWWRGHKPGRPWPDALAALGPFIEMTLQNSGDM